MKKNATIYKQNFYKIAIFSVGDDFWIDLSKRCVMSGCWFIGNSSANHLDKFNKILMNFMKSKLIQVKISA
ncbi:hypothetical protein B0181_05675 [Moraxella caviae]|uniref:Uncharacterized protein n=1 Tax=Moraxella caviae TaxID=34060 RepID=A0A1T0A285_9GAMM|nr:hypothetical protein [Moraxella caviae]OOR89902.1 hypothetical protein B0181_05675 [Moraxella caviae]